MINDIKDKTTLHDGMEIPMLGLGTWQVDDAATLHEAVKTALDAGYIHIDTAAAYQNEQFIGESLKKLSVNREDLFVTTKLWNRHQVQGYDATVAALKESLQRLQMDYVDLYLIHWPVPSKDMYSEAWKALIKLKEEGLTRSIGVSNFHPHHIDRIINDTKVVPAVNQVELHPWLNQKSLVEYCQAKKIQVEAYSPLMRGKITEVDLLSEIAKRYDKTPAQVVLRWNLQRGIVTIPKSVHAHRIIENSKLFDFELSMDDMNAITDLNRDHRLLFDPDEMDIC